jgi:hypothetical protein
MWGRLQTEPATGGKLVGQGWRGAPCGMMSLSGACPMSLPSGATVV